MYKVQPREKIHFSFGVFVSVIYLYMIQLYNSWLLIICYHQMRKHLYCYDNYHHWSPVVLHPQLANLQSQEGGLAWTWSTRSSNDSSWQWQTLVLHMIGESIIIIHLCVADSGLHSLCWNVISIDLVVTGLNVLGFPRGWCYKRTVGSFNFTGLSMEA